MFDLLHLTYSWTNFVNFRPQNRFYMAETIEINEHDMKLCPFCENTYFKLG